MLTELTIRDFAIIDEMNITFNEGLTVLTGETGAGKSIIINAIKLLAGGRGSVEYVRHGAKKAEIEGLFTFEAKDHLIYEIGQEYGIEIEDGQVVLKRMITSSGKSICRVNNKLVTLAILREFGRTLIDIHSQHETQALMDADKHIDFLDMYNGEEIGKTKKEYTYLYDKYVSLMKRYNKWNENEQEMAHRFDLLNFQKNEIENANLVLNEDKELEEERNALANFEQIYKSLTDAYNGLYGEQKGLEWLNIALLALENNQSYDPFIAEKAEETANHYYALEDIAHTLRSKIDSLQYDPNRLREIEARLDEINQLKKKYGSTIQEILTYLSEVEEELEEINNKDSHLESLLEQIKEVEKDARLEAKQLHDIRKKSAQTLEGEIAEELNDLYMQKASFTISFDDEKNQDNLPKLHKNGYDRIRFFISTNTGEPPKELSKVASGGELSRIMLAIKKIFARHQGVTSVIFDEVDTGVSGRVAQAIAEKIYQVSEDSQVLCITHLPQVAAMADIHKLIKKMESDSRTSTTIHEMTKKDQIEELSRMITGTKLTDTAKEHAKEMLDLAEAFKS